MSLSRTRSTQHKVYIPSSACENQYIMAKFNVTDAIVAKFVDSAEVNSAQPYEKMYQTLAHIFFNINDQLDLESGQFVANGKFTRVRFSPEKVTAQTEQQILFLYNPHFHHSQNAYFDGSKRVEKISLVFLANGDNVRLDSAKFHTKVTKAIALFSEQVGINSTDVRISDHQHLSYDLFAKDKGVEGTQAHKFRSIANRYAADAVSLPETLSPLTYAIVDLPLNRRIRKLVEENGNNSERFNPLYNLVADAFISVAKNHNLTRGAFIANGLIPIVRRSDEEFVLANGELQMLGYNPQKAGDGYLCKWSADKLVDTVQLVFVASEQNITSHGYGKFLNQIEQAMHSLAEQLEYVKNKEEMLIRFHQHIGFSMS